MGIIQKTISSNFNVPKLPRLGFIDYLGLSLACLLVYFQIASKVDLADKQGFIFVLSLASFNAHFLLNQFKSIETLLHKQRTLTLFIPTLAALSTLVIQALSRSYYSGYALGIFLLFWTAWMLVIRLIYQHYAAPLKLAVIHPASFLTELEHASKVDLTYFSTPPKSFEDIDFVILDPAANYSKDWLLWLAHADMYGVRTLSAPLVIETLTRRIPINMLHGQWAFEILAGRNSYHSWKRMFDLLGVILLSPLLLALAAIVSIFIYLEDRGPVFFWQERAGTKGKPFQMLKFRTMKPNAEANGSAFAEQNDPRITRLGKWLRKTRIDEIPQFWNVLIGEMSIIGPRPEQVSFAEQFAKDIPLYDLRHNVKPGITGWAQVMQGYAAGTDETKIKLCYDFYYVKHVSLGLDLRIIYQTFQTILTFFGAR